MNFFNLEKGIIIKIDPLINDFFQSLMTKDILVLFINYYELFCLSNKYKKFTSQTTE